MYLIMKYAEYYVKQNIVSLNIQFDIFTKSFINYLLTSKIALNHVKASIIIKKKKSIKNFHLYKVKFTLIYNHKNDCEYDQKILSIKKGSDKNNSYNAEPSIKGRNDGAQNVFPSKKIQLNYVNYSVNKREDDSVHIEKSEHNEKREIYEKDVYKKYNNNSTNFLRYNKPIKKGGIYYTEHKNLDNDKNICADKCINRKTENGNEAKKRFVETKPNGIHGSNNKNETKTGTVQALKEKNEENKNKKFENNQFCDLTSVLEIQEIFSKGEFSKEINVQLKEKKKKLCKYIMLPSMLTIINGKIKSINFLLNKKLSIILLVEIIVNRKNTSFFDIYKNRELDNMLKLKENIIQCKVCNKNIMFYTNINLIMPYVYLNIPNFFDHAFCEECETVSWDSIKDTDNNIYIFSNSLCFNYNLTDHYNIVINRNEAKNYRYFFFCEFCYNTLGYLENERNRSIANFSKMNNGASKINNNMSAVLCGLSKSTNKDEYVNINQFFLLKSNDSKYPLIENNPDKCKEIVKENVPFHEKKKTTDHFEKCAQKNSSEDNNNVNSDNTNCENLNLKIYLFKHKIKMLLKNKNIFKSYNDLLFLSEYMHNKMEKHNIATFYLKSYEQIKIIEIKILIKKLYICNIMNTKKHYDENSICFQKVMKVLYCLKKQGDENKISNSEIINISKNVYNDVLKMLINYSFKSDIFANALFSYLHLVQ
ncbi:conserved Plasmodium protein, unknown function [Plasmodium chabaudi adami]|uniref:Uncharacterized protein n=1 Tax=Plasmodium chabaudi adami TaxID=5826 RepID=A0A1D3LLX3_PLACE|nr:conserved Plasmodium protein, unknown function [Plasmodium chabaudi adami]